ncbi:basic amino acid ABC transporter substrate-binding protein [Deltaproteobacteria bacterium Smac51]|nr:basic amino acid ABC transporter substrate-binding protein [Deltaproteobacteria bacterium Smac51]
MYVPHTKVSNPFPHWLALGRVRGVQLPTGKTIMKKLSVFILAAVMALAASSLFARSGEKTITIAVDPNWPPLEFIDDNNQIVGFGIDYLTAACRESGYEAKFVKTDWDVIFSDLDAGKYDAVMSSVTVTNERRAVMDFTIPYYIVRQCLLIPINSPLDNIRQLSGQRVGTQAETTATEIVEKVTGAKSSTFPDIETAINALAAGELDAVICEDVVAADFLGNPAIKSKVKIASVIDTPGAEELYAVAVKKNNLDVLVALNDGIKAVKSKGTEAELLRKWF